MKTRTIERLDLLAAETENQLLESIRKHNETLRQIAYQRTVLAEYRERLAETWRHGGVVRAGEVLRATRFVSASETAESQVDGTERQARMQLEQAMQRLAQVQERRRGLDEAQRKAALLEERAAALRAERLQPWRPVSTVPGK
jgi:flagellar biosynthesis chaperone FliJ